MGCIPWIICVFVGDFYISGTQAAEVTKSLHSIDTRDCCIPGGSFFFLKASDLKAQKKFKPPDGIPTHIGSVTFLSKMYRIFLLHMPVLRKLYLETGTNNSILHFLWIPFLVVLGFAGLPESDQKTASLSFRQHILAKYPLPGGKIIK